MKKEQLDYFKSVLLKQKMQILNGGVLRSSEDLYVSTDDLPDEADLATNVINQQISFNMRERELKKLRDIEEALVRVDNGTFGLCEDCDEEIPQKRLEMQPWTTLCIEHAEEREKEQSRYLKHG
jgi:DnaK suppressor protein